VARTLDPKLAKPCGARPLLSRSRPHRVLPPPVDSTSVPRACLSLSKVSRLRPGSRSPARLPAISSQEDSQFPPQAHLRAPQSPRVSPPIAPPPSNSSATKSRLHSLRAPHRPQQARLRRRLTLCRLMFVGEGPAPTRTRRTALRRQGRATLNNMIAAWPQARRVYIATWSSAGRPATGLLNLRKQHLLPFSSARSMSCDPRSRSSRATAATYLLGQHSPCRLRDGTRVPRYAAHRYLSSAYLLRDPRQKKEAWATPDRHARTGSSRREG